MSEKNEASFFVQAILDEEAGVYISNSDITGLHVEANTLDEFVEIVKDIAPDLLAANHGIKVVDPKWRATMTFSQPEETERVFA